MLMLQGTCQPLTAVGQEEAFPCRQSRTSLPSSPAAQGYRGYTAILLPLGPLSPGGCSPILVPKISFWDTGAAGDTLLVPSHITWPLAAYFLFFLTSHVSFRSSFYRPFLSLVAALPFLPPSKQSPW